MVLEQKFGQFVLNVGTGNQSIAGLGFQPKIILFFPTRQTADGGVAHAYAGFGAGISSTERFAIQSLSEDNSVASDTIRGSSISKCIIYSALGSSSADIEADFVSLDGDGFTINITTAGAAYRVGYLALGGSDLNDVAIGSDTVRNSLGTKGYTGTGFVPNCLMLASVEWSTQTGYSNQAAFNLGFATSPTEQGYSSIRSQNGQTPSNANHAQKTDKAIGSVNFNGGSISFEAELDSFDAD